MIEKEINEKCDKLLKEWPQKEWLIENIRNAEIMLERKKKVNKKMNGTYWNYS